MDADNDADLDILVGAVESGGVLLTNDGGTFTRQAVWDSTGASAIAVADWDGDGDEDIYVAGAIRFPERSTLYRNEVQPSRYLTLELRGTATNRRAVGARVRVVSHGKVQSREVRAVDTGRIVFGLGGGSIVDTIEVMWPGGQRDVRTAVPVFSRLSITEGTVAPPPSAAISWSKVVPNPGGGTQEFEIHLAQAGLVRLTIYDIAGRRVWSHDRTYAAPGIWRIGWDGRDVDGRAVRPAVYFARVSAQGVETARRFVRIE
jgi:hypothetical protein